MSSKPLTDEQRKMIEENRQKALKLRQARNLNHPYKNRNVAVSKDNMIKIGNNKFKDTGGGFLIEEPASQRTNAELEEAELNNVLAAIVDDSEDLPLDFKECIECKNGFVTSNLWVQFDHPVCDGCRDPDDKHSLITRTEAKNEYLLKDCDLDKREPVLKAIIRKNPHNPRWGEMKLYLHVQIEKRALEVWGTEEALIEAKEARGEKKEKTKAKKYLKQLKELRMQVRSSLYDRTSGAAHVHSFGPDRYNEEEDNYTHDCECGYSETFEKL